LIIDLWIPKDIDSAWEQEITDRIRAVDNGTATGIDYDQAMQTI